MGTESDSNQSPKRQGKGNKMKKLYDSILQDLRDCASDEHGPLSPVWRVRLQRTSYDETVPREPSGITITTRYSRNPSKSNNGGEYYCYSIYRYLDDGRLARFSDSSYEDSREELDDIYGVGISQDSLESLAEFAKQRVLQENAPRKMNETKVRRRIEDALRKRASYEEVFAIATMLGVKFD
jgi:hypothetical protein